MLHFSCLIDAHLVFEFDLVWQPCCSVMHARLCKATLTVPPCLMQINKYVYNCYYTHTHIYIHYTYHTYLYTIYIYIHIHINMYICTRKDPLKSKTPWQIHGGTRGTASRGPSLPGPQWVKVVVGLASTIRWN